MDAKQKQADLRRKKMANAYASTKTTSLSAKAKNAQQKMFGAVKPPPPPITAPSVKSSVPPTFSKKMDPSLRVPTSSRGNSYNVAVDSSTKTVPVRGNPANVGVESSDAPKPRFSSVPVNSGSNVTNSSFQDLSKEEAAAIADKTKRAEAVAIADKAKLAEAVAVEAGPEQLPATMAPPPDLKSNLKGGSRRRRKTVSKKRKSGSKTRKSGSKKRHARSKRSRR